MFYTETETPDKHSRKRGPESQDEATLAKRIQQSSSSIETYLTYLKGVYSVKQLPSDEKYSIECVEHFVNLECVYVPKRITKKEAEEFRSQIVHGDIDGIEREKIDMDQVAVKQDDCYPKLVLVKGAPGVGKTTFSWELCRRWSAGKLLNDYSLVVLLRLRDENVQEAKTLVDLFQCGDDSLSTKFNVVDELRDTHGKGVLFILEGLDELPGNLRDDMNSIFMKLITGHVLPASTVMVTTRPWAVKDLPDTCKNRLDQHIEILGFTTQQIDEYVDYMIKDGVPEGLRTYISANPHISSAMYNPLHARIVVEVYRECSEENGSIFPNTKTELYTAYSTIIIHRYLTDHPAAQQWDGDLRALPPSIEPHFNNLCRVAYEGITKEKQQLVFSKADIPDGNATLGFMNSVQPLHRAVTRATSPSYNFLHFTLQEYLAAVYIWKNHTPQQHMILFETKVRDGTYKMILIYLAGLTKFKDEYTRCVLPVPSLKASPLSELSGSPMKTIKYSQNHILWLYESQNVNIFHEGVISVFSSLSFLAPQYYFALGYCIAFSKSFLDLTINMLLPRDDDSSWKMLVAGAMKYSSPTAKLKYLSCSNLYLQNPEVPTLLFNEFFKHISVDVERFTLDSSNNILFSDNIPESLLNLLRSCHNLKEIELHLVSHLHVGRVSMSTLLKMLGSKPCLEKLTIQFETKADLDILSDLIVSSSSLKTLTLKIPVNCLFTSTSLIFGFNSRTLKQHGALNVGMENDLFGYDADFYRRSSGDFIRLTQDTVLKIASVLRNFPHSLELLNLGCYGLDSEGFHELANSVAACSSLKELQFSIDGDPNFESDTSGLQAMIEAISTPKFVHTLHVTDCSEYLYIILLTMLDQHASIRDLVIEGAVIEKREAEMFASLLCNNPSLQVVDLRMKETTDESDLVLITDALQSNSCLKKFRIVDGHSLETFGISDDDHDLDAFSSQNFGHVGPFASMLTGNTACTLAVSIASVLKCNKTLEVLDITTFNSTDLNCKPIAQALCMNRTLKILKLRDPSLSVSHVDVSAFGDMLTKNKTLQVLHLITRLGPDQLYTSLMKGLAVNKTLQELGLCDDDIDVKDTVITCPEYVTNRYRIHFLP